MRQLVRFGNFLILPKSLRRSLHPKAEEPDGEAVAFSVVEPHLFAVAKSLRRRGEALQDTNLFLLTFILGVLIGAATFVVFAGAVASKDTSSLNVLLPLRQAVDKAQDNARVIDSELAENLARKANVESDVGVGPSAQLALKLRVQRLNEMAEVSKRRREFALSELEYARKQLDKAEAAINLATPSNQDAVTLLLAAGITRFGVLAIAIYLVQILVRLYQYNALVSAHYFAQADALLLKGSSPTDLGDLIAKLRLTVGFGKPDATIPERVLDRVAGLMETAAEHIKKKKPDAQAVEPP